MSMPTTFSTAYSYTNITQPGPHDVMIGRGGGTNHNPGNIRFRQLICTRKDEYKVAKRSQKPIIAQEIVSAWRAQVPPGRFLKQDERTMLWYDVGNEQAKVKAAQKLRDSNKDNSWTNNQVPGSKEEENKVKKRDPPQSLTVEMPQPFEMPPPVYEMPPPVYYAPVIKKQKTSSEDDTTPNTLFAADCLNTMKTDEGIQIYQV